MKQICYPSPSYFNLYTDEVVLNIKMVRFFVDDIILVFKSRAIIQYHLNNLYGIPCGKGFTVNTKTMNFNACTVTF